MRGDITKVDGDLDCLAAEIAVHLKPSWRTGLCKPPGSGDFSSAVLAGLVEQGLMDRNDYQPTSLGWRVRRYLGCGQ